MDIFNRKKLKRLEETLENSRERDANNSAIIKFLVEEPNSMVSKEIIRVLKEKYEKNRWSSLTRESHLSFSLIPENKRKQMAEDTAKRLTKYLL